jgi:hypothetical protein
MTKTASAVLLACTLGLAAASGANAQGLPDINGAMGTGVAPLAVAPAPVSRACLQLNLGAAIFNFNVTINPDVYPYTITGGTITGSICGAPWAVTGGSLSNSLIMHGQKSPPVAGCATTITVVGNFDNPSSYIGTYGFNGSSTSFNHHTLFLGYDRPTCP